MPQHPRSEPPTRDRIHRATIHAVATAGAAASVRAIAKVAGLTEGALYRHYTGRDQLLMAVYAELVEPMIVEKENLLAMRAPLRDKIREWVRCTYASFDRDPAGFAFVFLTEHATPAADPRLVGRQSTIFLDLIRQGRAVGEIRAIDPELAAALFIGLLLGVPRRIRAAGLRGPASRYIDEVAHATWLMLTSDPSLQ